MTTGYERTFYRDVGLIAQKVIDLERTLAKIERHLGAIAETLAAKTGDPDE